MDKVENYLILSVPHIQVMFTLEFQCLHVIVMNILSLVK